MNIPLNFKLLIRYNQVKIDENFINYVWYRLAIIFNFMFIISTFKFLLYIIFSSYKLNAIKVLKFIFNTIYISDKKKQAI